MRGFAARLMLVMLGFLPVTAAQAEDDADAGTTAAATRFNLGEAARVDAKLNVRGLRPDDSAVEFRHGATVPMTLLHSGSNEAAFEAPHGSRAFSGGAEVEGAYGGFGYVLNWEGSIEGSRGALALRNGNTELALTRDFDKGVVPDDAEVAARWRPDISLGGLEISLTGEPVSRDMGGRVSWSFEW